MSQSKNKSRFRNAKSVRKFLKDKLESQLAFDLPYNDEGEEREFLFDVVGQTLQTKEEEAEERKLDDLIAQTLKEDPATKKERTRGGTTAGEPRVAPLCPPITNRGVSKYQAGSAIAPQPCTLKDVMESVLDVETLQRGGYDGGIEIGLHGDWEPNIFEKWLDILEAKRTEAENSSNGHAEIHLGGLPFLVKAMGAKAGIYYRYVIEGAGLKFYIRDKTNEKIQDVRIRYGAESLIGRDFFTVHRAAILFLHEIGFAVDREVLSRVDMQIMVERSMLEFMQLILSGHAVTKGREVSMHQSGKRFETYTLGGKKSVQVCFYDKKAEMLKLMKSNPVKFKLMLDHCIGGDCQFDSKRHLTRIEFRLGRTALKALGVDSVEDLRNKESGIVDWLTSDWFRLLENPKVRGHENKAKTHEIWEEVRSVFKQYFPVPNGDGEPVR